MGFDLTEEQYMIRKTVREFAQAEIAPRARDIDETGEFPADIFKQMGELGFMGLPFPEKYGGAGADYLSFAIALEELAAASGSVAITYNAHVSLGAIPIYLFGTEAQKQQWLAPLAHGEGIGAFALTEPHSGSDSAAMKTVATLDGDKWVLNGQKMWITSGSVAHAIVVAAKTDPEAGTRGISNFIIPADAPGLTVGKNEPKMGMNGSPTNQLFFENCSIPQENLLGTLNEGFKQFMITLDGARISISAMALGFAKAAMEAALKYAKEREAFGQPIAEFQTIQTKLADMAIELEAAWLMIQKTAYMREKGRPITKMAAMTKVFASEAADRACWQAIQIFGGMGYSREVPVERLYRDNRLTLIGDGTSEIQRLLIAKHLLRER